MAAMNDARSLWWGRLGKVVFYAGVLWVALVVIGDVFDVAALVDALGGSVWAPLLLLFVGRFIYNRSRRGGSEEPAYVNFDVPDYDGSWKRSSDSTVSEDRQQESGGRRTDSRSPRG